MDPNPLHTQTLTGPVRRAAITAAALFAFAGLTQPAGAAITVTQNNAHEVTVNVSSGDNAAVTCAAGGKLRVNVTDYPAIACADVEFLSVYADSLSNIINLSAINAPSFSSAKLNEDIEIHAGAGGDDVTGSPLGDTIYGADGDDHLNTGPDTNANDVVWPGNGSDVVESNGKGADTVRDLGHSFVLSHDPNGGLYETDLVATGTGWTDAIGGFDTFVLDGTGGPDTIDASKYKTGSVVLEGGDGADTLIGPDAVPQFDTVEIRGEGGEDHIVGGDEDSLLFGGAAHDVVDGEGGADEIDGGAGPDTIAGGEGADEIAVNDLPATATVGANSVTVGGETDTITSGVEKVVLRDVKGGGIPNTVDASAWPGFVEAHLEAGDDKLAVGAGGSIVYGGIGHDEIVGGAGIDTVHGGDNNDTITGGGAADLLFGEDDDDKLLAADGGADSTLDCGGGTDSLLSDDGETGTACETSTHPLPPSNEVGDPQNPGNGTGGTGGNTGGNGENPPPPKDLVAPTLKLGKATLKKGVYSIKVTCPAGEVSCTGSATLGSVKKVGKKKLAFGTKSFTVAGGKSTTLKIKLSKKNLQLLKRYRKVAAQLRIDVRDAAGNRAAASARTTLKGGRR